MSRGRLANGPTRLLHVEDNAGDAAYLKAVLPKVETGYEITNCATLGAALELLRTETFDVVLLDLYLPDSAGIPTLETLRTQAPDVPIVVCTGDASVAREDEVLAAWAQDFVPKWSGETDAVRLDLALRHAIARNRWFQALRLSQRHVSDILEASDVGLFVLTEEGEVPMMNTHGRVLCGASRDIPRREVRRAIPAVGERCVLRVEPEQWLALSSSAIDWDGKAARLVTVRDVTDQTRADMELQRLTDHLQSSNAQLLRLVLRDPLTGVCNRRGFERALANEMAAAARHGWPVCAALVDCDDFKSVNDRFGHGGGDTVLSAIADRATSALRATDHIARVGGDEFLLLLPNAGVWQASRVCERVRVRVCGTPFELPQGALSVSVSIGVAQVPMAASTIEEVLRHCRDALSGSKVAGKNTVRVHGVREPAAESVRAALREDATFVPVARPVMALEDEQVDTWEFSCRSTIDGFERRIDYVGLAHGLQVVPDMDVALARVCTAEIRRSLAAEPERPVLLYTTAGSTRDRPELVRMAVALAHERPTLVVINEVRSTAQALAGTYERARAAGIRLGINNVGAGEVSLELLASMMPHSALLAEQVLEEAREGARGRARAESLVRFLTAGGVRVIAKGVISPEDVRLLRDIGVAYAMGPYWSYLRLGNP